MFKKFGWTLLAICVLLFLLLFASVAPIDDTPLEQLEAIGRTYRRLENFEINSTAGKDVLNAGWASINITPEFPIDMAGYGPRGPYNAVHDSLYSRIIVLSNGAKELAIISLDLLMFPRLVKQRVYRDLQRLGLSKNEIFLCATHTHNGYGNWDKSIAGEFIFGDFDNKNMDYLVHQIVTGVEQARKNKSPVVIGFQKINARELVINRLTGKNGTVDPYIRIIHLKKQNDHKALLVSFSGHAVNLDADIWELSRDYPGVLVDKLERKDGIDFAMFAAGMVGSHNIDISHPKGYIRTTETATQLYQKIIDQWDAVEFMHDTTLGGIDLDIGLPPSQLRISKNFHIRDWLFKMLMGTLHANIKVLELGDILLVGMPCDFSGELSVNNQLDKFAKHHGKKLFTTSFNGNYIGYITEDNHYTTCSHDEVNTLNWVGPYKGKYFTEIIKKIIVRTDR